MCGCFFQSQRSAAACAYDSSTDVFKINLVYKDAKGQEHELKWLIKVTRSDVNEVAEALLRHEKQGQRHTAEPLIMEGSSPSVCMSRTLSLHCLSAKSGKSLTPQC